MKISAYMKFIVAAIVAAGVAFNKATTGDDALSTSEAVDIVLVVLGALGVYALPNSRQSEVPPR